MVSSGPNSPGTMADDATVGDTAWSNPDRAKVSDNSRAIVSIFVHSHYLKATNFGFLVPSGAVINGVLVEIERLAGSTSHEVHDENVKLVKADGSIGSTNKADTATVWSASESYYSYGSSSDLWGETLTPSDVNDADFGVVLSVLGKDSYSVGAVDHIRITVYYTAGNTYNETVSDTLVLADTGTPVHTKNTLASDTMKLMDSSPTSKLTGNSTISDVLNLVDQATSQGILNSLLADTLNISDSSLTSLMHSLTVSDVLTLNDSALGAQIFSCLASDNIVLTDTVILQFTQLIRMFVTVMEQSRLKVSVDSVSKLDIAVGKKSNIDISLEGGG
jgi:hypothetical protein